MQEPRDPCLKPGLYRVYWLANRTNTSLSVAAIGINEEGRNWVAPTNWTRPFLPEYQGEFMWSGIHHVELITTQTDQILAHNRELGERLSKDKSGIADAHYGLSSSENIVAPTKE